MKHTYILYIVREWETAFMKNSDVIQPFKYFVACNKLTFDREEPINDDFFDNLIKISWDAWDRNDIRKNPRIAAISYMDNFYFHPLVGILSDGKQEMFLPNEKVWENPQAGDVRDFDLSLKDK